MKFKINIAVTFLLLFWTKCIGQTRYSSYNQLQLDSGKKYLLQQCSSFESSKPISKNRIKDDKSRVAFLNLFYRKEVTPKEIQCQMDKFFKQKWGFDTIKLGAITKYETRIYSEGNLELFISFSTFEEKIVFKRIYFRTRTILNCIEPNQYGLSQHDFKYLETTIIPIADFPFTYCSQCPYISCDTILQNKLKELSSSEYQFFLSSNYNDLNNMTWFRIDKYMIDYVDNTILKFVKDKNQVILTKLLYSPNHILSIYAMEALSYLIDTNQIKVSTEIRNKMEQVKSSDTRIIWQYSDVVKRGLTYKDLKIGKQEILAKFSQP